MLRLHQYVSRQFIIIVFFSISIFTLGSYFVLRYVEINNYEKTLKLLIKTMEMSIKNPKDLQTYNKTFFNNQKIRITLLNDNGDLIFDSQNDDETLENHNNRLEIIDARKKEFGIALRYSKTINRDLLYVVNRFFIDNETYFLRLSVDMSSILRDFYLVWIAIVLIFAIAMISTFFWSRKFNKKIRTEISKLSLSFNALANKDYKQSYNFGFTKEFVELGIYLKKLAKRLEKKEKQKRKYTAEIKLISKQKSDVISAISHEFNNPIAAILGYAQTLNEDPNLDIKIRERFLDKIYKNSLKISNMIDRLSISTKLDSTKLTLNLTTFDFNELVLEVIEAFKITNKDRVLSYVGEETIVVMDRELMDLVVTNLVQNAIKYSKINIDISLKDRVFTVKDYGIGMPNNELNKITQKFYRLDSQSWDNSLGLGLFFVASILKVHNLSLDIQSIENEGSKFSFKI